MPLVDNPSELVSFGAGAWRLPLEEDGIRIGTEWINKRGGRQRAAFETMKVTQNMLPSWSGVVRAK